MAFDPAALVLILTTLCAATVTGALGYGFSSLTVPVAVLFYTNRVLNPALVLVELAVNTYSLFINRHSIPRVWRRTLPMLLGLLPGVVFGSVLLSTISPTAMKLATYAVLLPLILLQAAGVRRPIHAERAMGVPLGATIGVLYAVTTISGPPLALMLNNQGFVRRDFRATLALIRITESSLTAIAYALLGLYSTQTASLAVLVAPGVLIGVPLGAFLIARLAVDTFRRVCMSSDAWVVAFGLSRTLIDVGVVGDPLAYALFASAMLIDLALLVQFFLIKKQAGVGRTAPALARSTAAPARTERR